MRVPIVGDTGELWAERKDGMPGVIHLGTFDFASNTFQESPEGGIQMDSFEIPAFPDAKITIKCVYHFTAEHFDMFRLRWLRERFPTLFWN